MGRSRRRARWAKGSIAPAITGPPPQIATAARARTSKVQKLGWLGRSMLLSGVSMVMPRSAVLYAKPLDEVRFLVDATARGAAEVSRSDALISVLSTLEQRRQVRRARLTGHRVELTS